MKDRKNRLSQVMIKNDICQDLRLPVIELSPYKSKIVKMNSTITKKVDE